MTFASILQFRIRKVGQIQMLQASQAGISTDCANLAGLERALSKITLILCAAQSDF